MKKVEIGIEDLSELGLKKLAEAFLGLDSEKTGVENKKESVDHPSHYNREGSMECIDEMILIFGKSAVKDFCKLNAWKYRYRAADKNGEEDLKKSDWYLKKYKELEEGAAICDYSLISTPVSWGGTISNVTSEATISTSHSDGLI